MKNDTQHFSYIIIGWVSEQVDSLFWIRKEIKEFSPVSDVVPVWFLGLLIKILEHNILRISGNQDMKYLSKHLLD